MRQNIILQIKICHSKLIVLKVPFRNARLKRSYVKANLNQFGFMLKTLNVLLTKCFTYPTEICKMPDCDCKLHNAKVWRLGNQQHLPELPSPQDASQSAKKKILIRQAGHILRLKTTLNHCDQCVFFYISYHFNENKRNCQIFVVSNYVMRCTL